MCLALTGAAAPGARKAVLLLVLGEPVWSPVIVRLLPLLVQPATIQFVIRKLLLGRVNPIHTVRTAETVKNVEVRHAVVFTYVPRRVLMMPVPVVLLMTAVAATATAGR